MIARVRMFAAARDAVGRSVVEVEVPERAVVADVRAALAAMDADLARLLPHCAFAVGADYATDATPVSSESEIACIPPVSGG